MHPIRPSITVSIDARALAYGGFIVEGDPVPPDPNGVHSTGWVLTAPEGPVYELAQQGPGTCQFLVLSGTGPFFSFTVTDAGTVEYDPSLQYLSGAGTGTLTVTGLPLTIDATAAADEIRSILEARLLCSAD